VIFEPIFLYKQETPLCRVICTTSSRRPTDPCGCYSKYKINGEYYCRKHAAYALLDMVLAGDLGVYHRPKHLRDLNKNNATR